MYSGFQDKLALADGIPLQSQIGIGQLVLDEYDSSPRDQQEKMVAQLVGKVFESASAEDQIRILEHLLRPVGVLSLFTIANGTFAKIRLKSGLARMQIPLEDAQTVQPSAVTALADYVQQVSIQTVDSLSQILMNQPALMRSAAAAVLVDLLMKRSHFRRSDDFPRH